MGRAGAWIVAGVAALSGPASRGQDAVEHTVSSGPALVRMRVEPSRITVAERATLTLEAHVRAGDTVAWPSIGDELGGFTVVGRGAKPPRMLSDGAVVDERVFTLEPFLAGEYEIPPLEFTLGAGEGAGTLETPGVTVSVASVLGDAEPDVAPARGEHAETAGVLLRPALIALGALAAAGFGAFTVARARRRRTPSAAPPSAESALAEIAREGGGVAAMSCLGPLIRRAVADAAVPGADRMTTDELLKHAEVRALPLIDASNLARVLRESDETRFGGVSPDEARVRSAANEALAAVRILRARPSVVPPEAPA